VEYAVLLDELSRVLREGVPDLNEAANRLGVPLSVVRIAFHDGVLKGYWKVADGKLLMPSMPTETTKRASASSPRRGSKSATVA